MRSKDRIFVWDAKNSIRTLDKMNNSRPIIKAFLLPYIERTELMFSSNFAIFFLYFCPRTKMLDTPKCFSDCESVNSVVSINISRDYYSGAKTGKTFKRTEKKKIRGPTNFIHQGA